MLLACRNDPAEAAPRALTSRERSVVSLAAVGHSLKHIAYELGIKVPTAASHLDTALRKLGVGSRAELSRLFASQLPVDDRGRDADPEK